MFSCIHLLIDVLLNHVPFMDRTPPTINKMQNTNLCCPFSQICWYTGLRVCMFTQAHVATLRNHWIRASGYFERRWRDDQWKCSFDTLSKQLKCRLYTPGALGCLRFLGFVDDHGVLAKQDVRQVVNVNTI